MNIIIPSVWLSFLLLNACGPLEQQASSLLDLARRGHRAAVESIRTVACHVVIENGLERLSVAVSGDYWRSSDMVRIREIDPVDQHTEDLLVKDSQVLVVGTFSKPDEQGDKIVACRYSINEPLGRIDVWRHMLLSLPGRKTARSTFDQLISLARQPVEANKKREGGHEFIKVDLVYDDPSFGDVALSIWFDPAVNYLVRKMSSSHTFLGVRSRSDFEVVRFLESNGGVFLPEQCELKWSRDGKPAGAMVTTLSEVHVNEPLPASKFTLTIPPGTLVADRIKGARYRVDSNGQPTGPIKSSPDLVTIGQESSASSAYGSQTEENDKSKYILMVVGAIVVCCLIGWIWQRRRSRMVKI